MHRDYYYYTVSIPVGGKSFKDYHVYECWFDKALYLQTLLYFKLFKLWFKPL